MTENNPFPPPLKFQNSVEEAEAALAAKREELERDIKGLHLRKQRRILRDFDRSHGKVVVGCCGYSDGAGCVVLH